MQIDTMETNTAGRCYRMTTEFDALNKLTQQSDYRGLCEYLIAAVTSITGATVELVEVYDSRGQARWADIDPDQLAARSFPNSNYVTVPPNFVEMIKAAPQTIDFSPSELEDLTVFYLGRLAGAWRFIKVGSKLSAVNCTSVIEIATIFANLTILIDRFERDPLTGLLNRQSFDDRFEDIVDSNRHNPKRIRDDTHPWLAIADIDHFKRVNDTHGHLFGDEILILVSQLMRQCFRFDDLMFRYGGEEFIVILNNTDAIGAELALQRYCQTVRNYRFPRIDKLTISIGWAEISDQQHASDVIHKADEALYFAKANGRDQVIRYTNSLSCQAPLTK